MTARDLKTLVQSLSLILLSHRGPEENGPQHLQSALVLGDPHSILPGGDLVSPGRWASLVPQRLPSLPGKGPEWSLSRHRTSEPMPSTQGNIPVVLGWPGLCTSHRFLCGADATARGPHIWATCSPLTVSGGRTPRGAKQGAPQGKGWRVGRVLLLTWGLMGLPLSHPQSLLPAERSRGHRPWLLAGLGRPLWLHRPWLPVNLLPTPLEHTHCCPASYLRSG